MILRLSIPLFLGAALFLGACGDDPCETCDVGAGGGTSTSTTTTTSASTGPGCTQTTGTLEGAVTLFEPAGGPNSVSSPRALIQLRRAPTDTPLLAMADDQGLYSVDLAEGAWIVGGESEDGYCTTFQPQTVTITLCETTTVDVVLEACVN
jgi:hypothetical protein